MKLVLTGITGFVGQNLMPMLLRECPDVKILTLNIDIEEAERLYPKSVYPMCTHTHTTDLEGVIQFNPEIVFHLATITTPRNDTDIIKPMLLANIEFGVLLLDALSKCNNLHLFVNTGSFAEYRFGPSEFDSAYLYSTTKTAFRAFVDYYAKLVGFKYLTAVPYSVYGGKMTVKRIMDYIYESMESEVSVDMTAGEQVLDFIHVDDIAGFFTYVVKNHQLFYSLEGNGHEFHLGTGRGTTLREIASIMEKLSGKRCNINWGGRSYRERDIMHAVAPITKNHLCNWQAAISIEEGLKLFLKQTH